MANRMIRVPWRAVRGSCGLSIGEASRLWSAGCSRRSTAGSHPGAKMTPGGAIPTSRAPTAARSASGSLDRQEHGRPPNCDLPSVGKATEGAKRCAAPLGTPSAAAQAAGTQDSTYVLGSVLSHAPVSETAAPSEGGSHGTADSGPDDPPPCGA